MALVEVADEETEEQRVEDRMLGRIAHGEDLLARDEKRDLVNLMRAAWCEGLVDAASPSIAAMARLLGISAEQLLGRDYQAFPGMYAVDGPAVEELFP